MASHYDYLIVGAGIAGTAAADGIRELDAEGSILLVGQENHLPYDRPPLSKKLWTGAKKLEDIYLHDREYSPTVASRCAWGRAWSGSTPLLASLRRPRVQRSATGRRSSPPAACRAALTSRPGSRANRANRAT
jgi:choline dehydrogenase-like flavoprotein